jgi:hypothetical protein
MTHEREEKAAKVERILREKLDLPHDGPIETLSSEQRRRYDAALDSFADMAEGMADGYMAAKRESL